MENSNEKTVRYLQDLHAAESGTEDIFAGIADDSDGDPQVRQRLGQYLQQTREQKSRIESQLQRLGGEKSSGFKDFINSALAKGSDLLNIGHDDEDKNTQDLIKLHAAEALHVGAYESLRAYSTTIGDHETANFAKEQKKVDEEIGRGILSLIGMKAPEAADNATDINPNLSTSGNVHNTGVNRDVDSNSGLGTSTGTTTYSGTDREPASGTNPTVYRDASVDPALKMTDTTVPGTLPNVDPTNPPGSLVDPTSSNRTM